MSIGQYDSLYRRQVTAGPRHSRWVPNAPTPKQQIFLASTDLEGLYGGAAGGGKTDVLLQDALANVDVPRYAALLLRKTIEDLKKPDALIDRAHLWLASTAAKWKDRERSWTFPSGAVLQFGYLENANDHFQYQGAQLQYIGVDELTQHRKYQYTYLFSRLRRLAGSDIPLKMRGTTNPGGEYAEWVYERFIEGWDKKGDKFTQTFTEDMGEFGIVEGSRFFIPSTLLDNPYIDKKEYVRSLSQLGEVEREQLLRGDWDIMPTGWHFQKEWFKIVHEVPVVSRYVRGWDTSLVKEGDPNSSTLVGVTENDVAAIIHQDNFQADVPDTYEKMVAHALSDPPGTVMAVERSTASITLFQDLKRDPRLAGIRLVEVPVRGRDELQRAAMWINRLEKGLVVLVKGPWNQPFIAQCLQFRNEKSNKDDRISGVSVAMEVAYKIQGRPRQADKTFAPGSPAYFDELARVNQGR